MGQDEDDDEGSTQDETRVPDLREVLTKEKKELEKLNDRIGNLRSTSWIQEAIAKTEAKRDRQEEIVRATQRVCEQLGLIKSEQLNMPGVEPPHSEPRHQSGDTRPMPQPRYPAIGEETRGLPEGDSHRLPDREQPALPAPGDCEHEFVEVLDGHQQCAKCGLIDAQFTTDAPAPDEQPAEAPKRGRGRPRKQA